MSKPLADHLFALCPQRFGAFGVERVGTNAAADTRHLLDFRDVAIHAIAAADLICRRTTIAAHTDVAAPCGIDLKLKAGAPLACCALLIESISCLVASGVM